jgi:hypothetical protein
VLIEVGRNLYSVVQKRKAKKNPDANMSERQIKCMAFSAAKPKDLTRLIRSQGVYGQDSPTHLTGACIQGLELV